MKQFWILLLILSFIGASSKAEPANPKAYLQMLYENRGGYSIPEEEQHFILQEGGHPQYGEIPYDSAAHILADLNLSQHDVFYDLGCGVGKLVLQVYLTTPVKCSVGIELSKTRFDIAQSCRKQTILDEHTTPGRDLIFLHQNITTANFSDVTVCFLSSLAFPPPLIQAIMDRLNAIGHDIKVISILPLPNHKQFKLIKTYQLPMSWASEGVDVCLYSVTPASPVDVCDITKKKRKKRGKRRPHQEKD
jgi:SAM-dependent methyltransferase